MTVYLHKRQLFLFLILIGAVLLIGNQILRNKIDTHSEVLQHKVHVEPQSTKLDINYDLNEKWYLQKCLNNMKKGDMTLEKLDIYLNSLRYSRIEQCK